MVLPEWTRDHVPPCRGGRVSRAVPHDEGRALLRPASSTCPRQDSNLRSRLRRAVLYPLSYGGDTCTPQQGARRG